MGRRWESGRVTSGEAASFRACEGLAREDWVSWGGDESGLVMGHLLVLLTGVLALVDTFAVHAVPRVVDVGGGRT